MLLAWVKQNKKLAMKITGVNFLLMALVLLFWSQPQAVMSENEMAAANLERMASKASGKSRKPASNAQNFKQAQAAHQEEQVRIFMIMMVLFGVGFLGYGFMQKEEAHPK